MIKKNTKFESIKDLQKNHEIMKSTKIIFFLLITSMFLLPFINFATAAKTPNYVGIKEGDEIIWTTYFDDDPMEDYYEDAGMSEAWIDNETDHMFDDEYDKDVVGWKIKILEIEKEDDDDGDEYVEYTYKLYIKEEDGDWEVEDKKDKAKIWKYDEDVYVDMAYFGLLSLVIADNVKWGKLAEELDDELDDDFDGNDESAGAEVETSLFFFMEKENGISTFMNEDEEDFDDWTTTAQYNDTGILMYGNYAYDDDIFFEFELQYRIVYEWWWAAVVIAVAAVVIVVVIIIVKKR
jgi:hypothetical protein